METTTKKARPVCLGWMLGGILLLGVMSGGVALQVWAAQGPLAGYVTWVGQGLGSADSRPPDSSQPVSVYARSDTVAGESVCLEYTPDWSNYVRVDCAYSSAVTKDAGSGFHHSNWHCTIPAQAAGTTVNYQLYIGITGACSAGGNMWTGFNWSYTVGPAPTGSATDIRLNEVMYDQVGASTTRYANGEWVELYNQGVAGTCVNLDSFRLDDQDNFPQHLYDFPNVKLCAGEYLVLYTGRPAQSSQAGPRDYTEDFRFDDGARPPLPPTGGEAAFVLHQDLAGVTEWNDAGDEIILYVEVNSTQGYQNGQDTAVDYVQWENGNSGRPGGFSWSCGGGSSDPVSTQGRSIALIPGQAQGDCASWEESGASGLSGRTGNGGSTRGPHSMGGGNAVPTGLGVVCATGGPTPVIDGAVDTDPAWDYSGGTRYIPENDHAFPAPPGASSTQSDYSGEGSAATYWTGGAYPTPYALGNGDADVKDVWVTSDNSAFYVAMGRTCALWTSRYSGSDYVDVFIAIDTDNSTGAEVYRNVPYWNKRVDFAGWSPEYIVAVERIATGNDYAALSWWDGTAWVDVRAGATFAYGTYWAGDYDDCTVEFRVPWTDLGLAGPPADRAVWNLAVYTTHDAGSYDMYDSGPGSGTTLFFEQVGDYPQEADYPCGLSDPVVIAYEADGHPGTAGDEALCGDGAGGNLYQESDNSYEGDDPLDGGNQAGSDNYGTDDVDSLAEYYALEFNLSTCAPTAVEIGSFTAEVTSVGVLLRWETVSEQDNVGFNVYRSTTVEGEELQLNRWLIPAKIPGGMGGTYWFSDMAAVANETYYYRLEDVDTSGQRQQHGPVAITVWRVYLPVMMGSR